MKTKLLVLALTVATSTAAAKTDTTAQIDKLKTNAENSEANYNQYKSNLDIVNKNINQADMALKDVKKMNTQLIQNTKNVDKNKLALVKLEQDLNGLKAKEQAKIKSEEAQIAEVKKMLEKLEANKKQREMNLVTYDQKIEEVKKEQAEWGNQVAQMASLQKQLSDKEKKAGEEKAAWSAKRKDYESEATKWQAQAQNSRETYSKYKRLDD